LIIRILYGVSQVAIFAVMALMYTRISAEGDDKKTLKVKPASPMGPQEEQEMTYKEYDMSELQKLAKSFAVGAAMTVGIHVYMKVVPALFLQMVTQPVTLYDHALFCIYMLKKDPSKNEKLKRPFAADSPLAKLEAMKKQAETGELERQKKDEEPQAEPVAGDSAVTTGSEPISRAERRPRRVENVENSQE